MKKYLLFVGCGLLLAPVSANAASDYYGGAQTARSINMPGGTVVTKAITPSPQTEERAPTLPVPPVTGGTIGGPGGGGNVITGGPDPEPVYGIDNCMNDLNSCISAQFPEGIAALYNTDMRNSVINGMNLCANVVDKCMNDAKRLDGKKAYYAKNDVWVDFNSRVIQPAYYTHVLMRTQLTPNQAENTCLLLDRNTYGSSFTAVAAGGAVTNEYQEGVNPYNNLGTGKGNPMGQQVNKSGRVDAQRGHYARWDATAGECLVRVAAYNKDELITDKFFFFGNHGGNQTAEKWVSAGTNFTCKKELFEFNLMRDTQNVAVNVGTGAVVAGAGIGAIAAHAKVKDINLKATNCANDDFKELLSNALSELNQRNDASLALRDCGAVIAKYSGSDDDAAGSYSGAAALKQAGAGSKSSSMTTLIAQLKVNSNDNAKKLGTEAEAFFNGDDTQARANAIYAALAALKADQNADADLKSLTSRFERELTKESRATSVDPNTLKAKMKELNGMGKLAGAGIGAAIGVGVGGLATAITAFVEMNNITCRIGDGLEITGFGKSGRVKTLKEYYVEWALRLPDTVMPQQTVTECNSWNTACGSIVNIYDCAQAAVNYLPKNSQKSTQVNYACEVSGSTCVANNPVAVSYGACP